MNFCYNGFMKKIILIIALVLLLMIVAVTVYMHTVFIPVTLKTMLQEQGQNFLGRKITCSQLRYSLTKGVTLEDFKIQQKDNPEETFLSVERINFNILLVPLLKDRTVIIPSLILTNPQAALTRQADHLWNITDLFQKKPASEKSTRVFLKRIIIENGAFSVIDQAGAASPLYLVSVNTEASLSLPQSIEFKTSAGIKDSPASLYFQGSFDLRKKALLLTAAASSIDCVPSVLPLLDQKTLFELLKVQTAQTKFQWQPAQWSLQGQIAADVKVKTAAGASVEGAFETQNFTLSSQDNARNLTADSLSAHNAVIQTPQGSWTGPFSASGLSVSFGPETLSVRSASASADKPKVSITSNALSGESLRLIDFQLSKDNTGISVQSQLHIINADLKTDDAHIQGDLAATQFQMRTDGDFLKISSPLTLTEAILDFKKKANISGTLRVPKLDVEKNSRLLTVATQLDEDRLTVALPDGITLTGSPKMDLILNRVSSDGPSSFNYDGTLWLNDTTVNGIKDVGEISGLQGRLSIATDSLQADGVTFRIFETPVNLSGRVRDLINFQSELLLTAKDVALKDLAARVQSITGKTLPVSLEGKTDLEVTVRGPLKIKRQIEYEVKGRLQNASLQSAQLPKPLTNIYGDLRYKDNFISWQDLTFQYDGQNYDSSGAFRNFTDPSVNVRLKSRDLVLSAFAKSQNKIYDFSRFEVQGKNSMLKATGTVDTASPGLKADILAEARLDLSELSSLPQAVQKFLTPINPRGTAYLKGQFTGPLKKPLQGRLVLNYQSELMRIYGYRIDNLSVDGSINANQKSVWSINSNLYNGLLSVQAKVDFSDPSLPSQIQGSLKGADITNLKNDSPLKEKPMSGILDVSLSAYGPLKSIKDITGNGEVSISNGHIWTANLLKGVWEHLLIEDYRNIDFTGGNAKFQIKDKRFVTNSLFLYSTPLNLEGKGWVGFNKEIDMDIYPDFKMSQILISNDLNKGVSAAMAQTRGFLSIKLYGTVDKPKHKVMTHPNVLLQKGAESAIEGAGVLFEGVQDAIGDLFP